MGTTDKVVVGAVVGLLVYEGYTIFNDKPNDTISESVVKAMRRPLIPFALGMLVGHFVWQFQDLYEKEWAVGAVGGRRASDNG